MGLDQPQPQDKKSCDHHRDTPGAHPDRWPPQPPAKHGSDPFFAEDRPRALDLLGFASQLLFNTFHNSRLREWEHSGDAELAVGAARAHNRGMAEFCAVDRRLLSTLYVPLGDIEGRQWRDELLLHTQWAGVPHRQRVAVETTTYIAMRGAER